MVPDDPTWDDTGFDAGNDENSGFLSSDPGARKRVTATGPQTPQPPPHKRDSSRGPLFWFGVLAGVVFVVAVIGGFFYWISQPSIEEQAFMAPTETTTTPEPTSKAETSTAPEVDLTDEVVHDEEALDLLFGEDTTRADNTQATESPAPASAAKPLA